MLQEECQRLNHEAATLNKLLQLFLCLASCYLLVPTFLYGQNGCGDRLNWTASPCQVIGSGSLNTALVNGANDPNAWTVISRHGEYAQNETECNIPSAITQANSNVTITATAHSYTCGDWYGPAPGTVRTAPSSWSYSTGDMQWNTFHFQYGTVILRGRMPSSVTYLWPAFWLLGSNCQDSNKFTGDTANIGDGCPNLGSSGYIEIDMVECYNSGGWCQFHIANPGFGIGGNCDVNYPVDTNYHVWTLHWTASAITIDMDGTPENGSGCNQKLNGPMFFINQIQTGGVGGAPRNANLPASSSIDYIKVCNSSYTPSQCSSVPTDGSDPNVIFFDDFNAAGTRPSPPTGLKAIVK